MGTAVLKHMLMDNPYETDANLAVKRRANPGNPNVGKEWTQVNLTTRIGGLARIKNRLNHHERAAEIFKNMYEARFGGQTCIDHAKQRVDITIMAHDAGMANRVDNAKEVYSILQAIGKRETDLLVGVIILGAPVSDFAEEPGHHRQRSKVTGELLDVLDRLAHRWGLLSRRAIDGRV